MIAKLDILIEGGRGDEQYKELFGEIMLERCENHSTMKDQVWYAICSCYNHHLHQHPLKFPLWYFILWPCMWLLVVCIFSYHLFLYLNHCFLLIYCCLLRFAIAAHSHPVSLKVRTPYLTHHLGGGRVRNLLPITDR